jgi:uncharacterized protein
MSILFADTSFFVAYLNSGDRHHALALEWMTESSEQILTTDWVLAELGNFLAEGHNRRLMGVLFRAIIEEDRVEIAPADHGSFLNGLSMYVRRPDQSWSFTDCTSFCLMKARKIRDALTTDHHFQQAGFTVLLK